MVSDLFIIINNSTINKFLEYCKLLFVKPIKIDISFLKINTKSSPLRGSL